MTLALTATDNQDGTGVAATVSGSDAGTPVTVYSSPVPQGFGTPVWTGRGSRAGDGSLTLALPPGYWWLYAAGTVSGAAAQTPPTVAVASLAADSVQNRCELAVVAKIQTLSLAGLSSPPGTLPPAQVRQIPTLESEAALLHQDYPAVLVWGPPFPETLVSQLTGMDDVGYPVAVAVVAPASAQDPSELATFKLWRQQILRALRYQRLPGVPEIINVLPEPQALLNWKPHDWPYVFSTVVFRCISRETRGA